MSVPRDGPGSTALVSFFRVCSKKEIQKVVQFHGGTKAIRRITNPSLQDTAKIMYFDTIYCQHTLQNDSPHPHISFIQLKWQYSGFLSIVPLFPIRG